MALVLTNNAKTTLASGITAGATSLTVAGGTGALFPANSGSDHFPLTLVQAGGAYEIVKCTARSGDTFTIVRAQEGTSGLPFSTGDIVALRLTAATILEFWNADNDGAGSGLDADLLDGMQPASANTASTVVNRDGSGNFAAGTITAALAGNATSATNQSGGTVSATTIAASGNTTLSGDLQVDGSATIGDAAGDTHTINGAVTANHAVTVTGLLTANGGVSVSEVDCSGSGSAADCAVSVGGDVGVGMFSPGIDQLAFATAGVEVMRIDTDGSLQHIMDGSLYPGFMLRGFCNFNASGVLTENSKGNCSSITDNGIGRYTYNFDTNMPDTDYGTLFGSERQSTTNACTVNTEQSSKQVTDFPIFVYYTFLGSYVDINDITVGVIR